MLRKDREKKKKIEVKKFLKITLTLLDAFHYFRTTR